VGNKILELLEKVAEKVWNSSLNPVLMITSTHL
jgi:hypothetical protein